MNIRAIKAKEKASRLQFAKAKKLQRQLKVTFENPEDRRAVGPAVVGMNYDVGMQRSGLTPGQVAYRQKRAREAFGLPKGIGFKRLYQRGESPVAQRILKEILPAVEAKLADQVANWLKHPTPKVVEEAA